MAADKRKKAGKDEVRFKKLPEVMYTTFYPILKCSPKAFMQLPVSLPYMNLETGKRERYPVRKVAEDLARENEVLFIRVPSWLFMRAPSRVPYWGSPFGNKDAILNTVIIYDNGIFAVFNRTDSNGVMRGRWSWKRMKIEFVPAKDIDKIHRFKFTFSGLLLEPFWRLSLIIFPPVFYIRPKDRRVPTGFHIQTKDGRICIFRIIVGWREYKDMVLALKKCLGKRWSDVYRERILYGREITRLQ